MSMEMNKALDLLREIRPSIPKEVLELWCKDRDAFLASHPAVEQAGGDERATLAHRSEFHQHLKECADEVATWPSYKREALTQPSPASDLDPHAEAFNEAPAEALKSEQAEAELEKQEPVGEVRESGGTLTAVIVRHSYATKLPVGTKLYAAPVSQAQRSVPEEFSFEYRHPNGECHTVTVSREQVINEMPDFLFEALCSKLCNCEPVGETNVVECRCDEYAEEFKLIAAAPGKEGV